MRRHAETLRDRLEVFALLVNAGAGAPPPCLMDEGTVCRIHQPDNAVVHVAGQIGGEMRGTAFVTETRQQWWRRQVFGAQAAAACIRDVDPGVAVALHAGIGRGVDAGWIERVLAGERGNLAALAGAGLEGPAVILA